jgi:nicotinamidase-related amidase
VRDQLWKDGITDVVIYGVQTEWCVMQTSKTLLNLGLRVHVPVDATTTQDEHEHRTALRRMQQMGVLPVTTHGLIAESLLSTNDERSRFYVRSIAREKAEAAVAGAG